MHEQVIIAMTIIAIVLITGMTLNGLADKLLEGMKVRHQAKSGLPGQNVREIADRQQIIEDRLRVLERIATDKGSLLADEIEALRRDTPVIGQTKAQAEVAAQ